jgi:APA family basic amino acid/polyamine antiporter
VIGASRITYAMASYRQLPEIFRRVHPRFKTPYISLIFFAGILSILTLLPGKVDFLGTMYSFGAMLSFTIAHLSLIALRAKKPDEELVFRGRPNLRVRGIDWPIFAFIGGIATGLAWLVVVIQTPGTRYAGLGWLIAGFVMYILYRRRVVHASLTETVRAPIVLSAAALEYRNILVPVAPGRETEEALDVACRLATERRARVAAIAVVEIPLELPLDAEMAQAEAQANQLLDYARTIGDSYGVDVVGRIVRDRSAGRAIVREAEQRNSEIIVMGAPRRRRTHAPIFGGTTDYVLKHAPCRVMVVAARAAA